MRSLVTSLALLLATSCGSQLTVKLTLSTAANDIAGAPQLVKINTQAKGETKETEHGPFAIDGIPDGEFASIAPGTPFFIDVFGCLSQKKCTPPDDVNARGCTPVMTLDKTDGHEVTIVLHNESIGAQSCPPPLPP